MISDIPNVSLGKYACSVCTRRIALKYDYQKKRMDMPAYNPVEIEYLKTVANIFIIPSRQNQFFQENIVNKSLVRQIANAMTVNSAFTELYSEKPIWYQQFHLR